MNTANPVNLAHAAAAHTARSVRDALAEPALCAAVLDPGYIPQAHHWALSAALDQASRTPNSRTAITTPPQVGKSLTSSVWTPFCLLARNPRRRIIIGCATGFLARRHGKELRDRIKRYGHHYGLHIAPGSNRQDEFWTTEGGYVLLVGIGGMTTGVGADDFFIDDPFPDWAAAASPTIRESTWMWATSVVRTRLRPGGRIYHIATRWNIDDLVGRWQKAPGAADWNIIRLPAIAGPGDPLGRPEGAPLPVPEIDENDTAACLAHWESARREQPWAVWQALYQCDPQPAGGALATVELLESREIPCPEDRVVQRVVAVDPSVGGQTSDGAAEQGARQDTCGIIAAHLADDGRLYLTHDRTRVASPEEWARTALLLAYQTGAGQILIEKNQGGSLLRTMVAGRWRALVEAGEVTGQAPRLTDVTVRGAKADRANTFAGLIETDRVRFATRLESVYKELVEWRPGLASPGRIDAAGIAAFFLLPDKAADGTVTSTVEHSKYLIGQTARWGRAASNGQGGPVRIVRPVPQ